MIGGALAEIVTVLIPNQRLDRVERFLIALSEEVSRSAKGDLLPKSEGANLELLEAGIQAASETHSHSKTFYLARYVSNGLSGEESETIRAQRVLRIISELDPGEMILLLFYTRRSLNDVQDLRDQHPSIFDVPTLFLGANQKTRKRNAEHEAAKRHLV